MPVSVSYPGVYIEEVPSSVRPITGVATALTAFVGYTRRGQANAPVEVFSFADFERAFGGLDQDSDLSYAVYQYFLNGGSHAWIVRVASGAGAASVTVEDPSGNDVLIISAASEGDWGNSLRVRVDYDTSNPHSYFNLSIAEILDRNGAAEPARSETHRNLSMNAFAPNYVEKVVNANSRLVNVTRATGAEANAGATASSVSGKIDTTRLGEIVDGRNMVGVSINGGPTIPVNVRDGVVGPLGSLTPVASAIENAVNSAGIPGGLTFGVTAGADTLTAVLSDAGGANEKLSVRFFNATSGNAADILRLGVANGGTEVEAAAQIRPARSGTAGSTASVDFSTPGATGSVSVELLPATGPAVPVGTVNLWTAADTPPANYEDLRGMLQAALRNEPDPVLAGAEVSFTGGSFIVVGGGTATARIKFTGVAASLVDKMGLLGATPNVAAYGLGREPSLAAQSSTVPGANGVPPSVTDLQGSRADKTGIYALEDVDLFTILCLPGQSDAGLLSAAIAYAEERRSFAILDLPHEGSDAVTDVPSAKAWMAANGLLFHKNAAAYFPRIHASDPLENNRIRSFPNCGAVAGLYARTDAARGVWKAPAGIEAQLRGVRGFDYVLSDPETGVLNPLGLNCLRSFPGVGPVAWGARTLDGADIRASQWKYVPVRRLALFLEESLYRGTQWVVFEPNDEPLWAQIRLNVGAFMNGLFRQGAFQGASPRDAYLVKCDRETTTQADIDLGIVNIVVGFAPLKPAEFVIIKIQQLAGQSQV